MHAWMRVCVYVFTLILYGESQIVINNALDMAGL